jgi:hypothetical protein
MKKVLVGILGIVGVGAMLGVFFVYQSMQIGKLISGLRKFEMPDKGFEGYENTLGLKYKPPPDGVFTSTKPSYLKTLTSQPAPLHEVKVGGDANVGRLVSIAKDASKPENVRCAAAIILAHASANSKKKEEIATALIDTLQEKEGRVGECASVVLQKIDLDAVPQKIGDVLKSATDQKVRLNAFRAITLWVVDEPKRKRNQVVMEELVKGMEEKDRPTLLLILANSRRCQFRFEGKEGKKSLGEQLEDKILPQIASDDEELAKAVTAAIEFQYSYMSDEQKKQAIQRVAAYSGADRKKHVRLNALSLLRKINGELAQNTATIADCDLDAVAAFLESDDPDFLKPALEIMKQCGTQQKHRLAVKTFKDRTQNEELKKLADEGVAEILKREEGGE